MAEDSTSEIDGRGRASQTSLIRPSTASTTESHASSPHAQRQRGTTRSKASSSRSKKSGKRVLQHGLDIDTLEEFGQHESRLEGGFLPTPIVPILEGSSPSETGSVLQVEPSPSPSFNFEYAEEDDESQSQSHHSSSIEEDPPDNSPYPQVRASVSATDDINLSINTPRMWVLSLLFALLGSAANMFFSLRYPSVTITPIIALLLVHPFGVLWDQSLKCWDDPKEIFVNGTLEGRISRSAIGNTTIELDDELDGPDLKTKVRLWLAQGRWNEKEHACVYVSSNVSFGFAFATDVIVEQRMFYHQQLSPIYQFLLVLSTQILGYAVAGLAQRYLVRPSGMIWPSNLASTTMFRTLHNDENRPANGWTISRFKFFLTVFLGSFAFYFLPGLLIPALSYFNVLTWFAPNNVPVANLFGVSSGLGLFPVTFDWTQIAYTGSPLVVPFWAAMNVVGGLVLVMWIIAPILYYSNTLYSAYMPILSSSVFDNTGKPYDVSKILTSDYLFDEDAYNRYSRVFLPITYVLSYAVQFAALSALITHTACWHGKDIWKQWRRSLSEATTPSTDTQSYQPIPSSRRNSPVETTKAPSFMRKRTSRSSQPALDQMMGHEDVHNRLMRRYKIVPFWWYGITGAITLAVGIFVVEYYPVHLPWYGLLLAFGICAILFIPIGIVMAITNQQSSIFLICQLACGAIFPGRPVANMVFVTYGYITSTQGMKFCSDLKLGHYMKVPPRLMFIVQLVATIVSSITQVGVLCWMLPRIKNICTPDAVNGFTCPLARVHFNGSILWGVVGPQRFFGPGALYRPLFWAFLVGAIAPIIVWLIAKRKPGTFWRKVSLPVLFGSLSWIPPATGLNFSVWALVCFIFNHVIRKNKEAWWRKYNMTLSAALDAGVAFGVVMVFFAFVYTGLTQGFRWWGTEVYKQGCDWLGCAYKTVAPGEIFGPDAW